jgi:hypothetical protein
VDKAELKDLKSRVNPKQVYGKYVSLKKEDKTYVGRCPFHNETTPSFKIDLRDGEWLFLCFGCKKGGDVIAFLQHIEKLDMPKAVKRLQELVDGAAPAPAATEQYRDTAAAVDNTLHKIEEPEEKKVIPFSEYEPCIKALRENKAALDFLHARGLTNEQIERDKLGFKQTHMYRVKNEANRNLGWITFPRVYGDKILSLKFRSIAEKDFSQVKGMNQDTFFGHDDINPFEPVFMTEGELDKSILSQAGFCAVSPQSAGAKITPEMRDALKMAPAIYLAGDNDGDVGNKYMAKLGRELGEKTYVITWDGAKDANELFLKSGGDVENFKKIVERHMESARSTPIEGFTNVVELLHKGQDNNAAIDPRRLHFKTRALDEMNYNPAGSMVIVYSTYTGTGKSILLTYEIATHEAKRGEVVCVLTPEIRGQQYLSLLASQLVGPHRDGGLPRNSLITRDDFREAAKRLRRTYLPKEVKDHYHMAPENMEQATQLYVAWQLPVTGSEEVIAFMEEVIKRTGCTRFIIDTLHKIVSPKGGEQQTEAEGRTAKAIESLGIKYGTIFVLVGQSNKEGDSIQMSHRDEHGVLRGSRELQDAAASIYLLHRKRLPIREGENPDETLDLKAGFFLKKERFRGQGKPQTWLTLDKNCSIFYEYESAA